MTVNSIRASRSNFSALYTILYDSIDSHIQSSSIKLRGWHSWEKYKSQGLRKRMTSYVTVARIIYGKNINLTTFMKFLYQQFPFLSQYVTYETHDLDINVVMYTVKPTKNQEKSSEPNPSSAKNTAKTTIASDVKKPPLNKNPKKMTSAKLLPSTESEATRQLKSMLSMDDSENGWKKVTKKRYVPPHQRINSNETRDSAFTRTDAADEPKTDGKKDGKHNENDPNETTEFSHEPPNEKEKSSDHLPSMNENDHSTNTNDLNPIGNNTGATSGKTLIGSSSNSLKTNRNSTNEKNDDTLTKNATIRVA